MRTNDIRKAFLDYFARNGHQVVRSSSLVPANDPTLYFTNAGMVQFKDVFIGQERRDYARAASSQKCLRVSGKHNDLETVGRTTRHHTFFEMLGNFSFGDYFKREAIDLAWRFLKDEVGLDPQRMAVTVFGGDEEVPADEEAAQLWVEVAGVPADRVLRLGRKDNFWAMGDEGPCGPCTEIHYWRGDSPPGAEELGILERGEGDVWVEVWNNVFMQFNRAGGTLTPLERTGVDTGMGLERLAAVVQGVPSTFDTDLLLPLIEGVAEAAGKRYGDNNSDDVSMRVIADHARATAFCIADGVFPEKGGREYVLRRIMRRAIRHGKLLGFEEPFFERVCLQVGELMGEAFPELIERRDVIEKIVQAEEAAFRRTLDRGLLKLGEELERIKGEGHDKLEDGFVGNLYATDGFPIDLTRLIAEESGVSVNEERAHAWVMQTHGAAESKIGDAAVDAIYKKLVDEHGATRFVGYEHERADSRILALVREGEPVERAAKGERVDIIVEQTPFYARAGGQVGDSGEVVTKGGAARARVHDTIKPGGALYVHDAEVLEGELSVGDAVELSVDAGRRQKIKLNHSATHLLHHALRTVLGPHVAQKGSEVAPERLRFDFSHFEGMTTEEIERVEALVNAEIRRNEVSRTDELPFDEAKRAGAMALFGEKYGDRVRVVRIGSQSVELCGGTHVARAGDIGIFRVLAEEPLALGVRRIACVTGEGALAHDQTRERQLREAAMTLKVGPDDVADRAEKLLGQLKKQEREIAALRQQLATGGGTDLMQQVREVGGVRVLATRVDAADPKTLRDAGDKLRDKLGSGVIVLGGEHNGKATLLAMVSKDLAKKVHAGKLVGKLAQIVEGRGGGRPDMAQAGGPNLAKLDEAIEATYGLVEQA